MNRPLRVLFIETVDADIRVAVRELECQFAVTHKRIDSREALVEALQADWDLIIAELKLSELTSSEWSDSGFCGQSALRIIRDRGLETPFVFLASAMNESVAGAALKCGANDVLPKQNLSRLAPVVDRELRVVDERHFYRRSDDLMRASYSHLASILDSAQEAVVSIDEKHRITVFSKGAEAIFGYTAQEAKGQPLELLLPAVEEQKLPIQDPSSISDPAGPAWFVQHQLVARRKDGRTFPAEAGFSRVSTDDRGACAIFLRDITDRKNLEDRLRQAQKMEAVGRLAGGVAHDFNNLLTIISGFSELLMLSVNPADPNRDLIEQIQLAGERASRLTRQLLAFSRQTVLELKVLNLNEIIADTEAMLKRLIGEDIILSTAMAPGLCPVRVDAGQMEQIIMNLAVNARDAMPLGGRLTIETKNVHIDDAFAAGRPEIRPGEYVLMAVSDTGCGMSPEVQARLFEPFFTTKEAGKGTGLGLATVYGIVKESGGQILAYSEVDRGSSFKIYLPAAEAPETSKPMSYIDRDAGEGTETILLVEDEDAVRAMTRLALRQFGYTVYEASRGADAIRFCEQFQGPLDLLITDVVMPEMGGRQLVERIALSRPELKVIYLSGYTDDAIVRHGVLQADVAFLQKPFSMGALLGKVREVLDARTVSQTMVETHH